MKAKNLIRIILFSLLATDCMVVSAQNCEEIFLNRLGQTYHQRKPHFIKQVRNAVISPKIVNPPDLQTLPEDSIILVCQVFFTKGTIKLIDQGKIDKSQFLCYFNPKSIVLKRAIPIFHGDSLEAFKWGKNKFTLEYYYNNQLSALTDYYLKYQPEIVFISGCALWDGFVFFVKNGEIQTLDLKTGIMEPITENNTYVKDNLNMSLGVMTKPYI
ncbi:MAG: hypothetical protein ACLTTW_10895 [Coprobacter sp.]